MLGFEFCFIDAGNLFLQCINVYTPRYETAGKFWPIVHDSMIFSLVLMHAIAVGIFTLKKLSKASTYIFPLPVLTLLFNWYCRKRFLPNFVAYSAEVCLRAMTVLHCDTLCPNGPSTTMFHCALCFLSRIWFFCLQSLIKKDRQEENDPAMTEFFNKLVTAYQDPSLMPLRFSSSTDDLNSPLISSAQVRG